MGSTLGFVFKSRRVRKCFSSRAVFTLSVVPCRSGCLIIIPPAFYLSSGIQLQFLQASCGVQGSARGLQAPAEPTDRWEPNVARWAWTENSGRPDGEAAAAAGHRGPAGTEHLHDLSTSNSNTWFMNTCRVIPPRFTSLPKVKEMCLFLLNVDAA